MSGLLSAIREISREIFQGEYTADTTPSGTVKPVSFTVSYSPSEIAAVLDAGASADATRS